jgi:hypothetical protein
VSGAEGAVSARLAETVSRLVAAVRALAAVPLCVLACDKSSRPPLRVSLTVRHVRSPAAAPRRCARV